MDLPDARLDFVFTYRVRATGPLDPTEGSPQPARQYWSLSEATIDGPDLRATLAGPGLDWMGVHDDGFWRPDCRLQFRTDDDAIVLMRYTGLVEQTAAFEAAAAADRETDWADQYLRMQITFETGAERHAWLNRSLFVAYGRLLGIGRMEYRVYRVV